MYQITPLGLDDSEHTSSTGYKSNAMHSLNASGLAVGNAQRFNGGSSDLGQSAWLFNGTSTLIIGLIDAEHTSSTGYKSNTVQSLNASGLAAGNVQRFNGGSSDLGQSAWLFNGTSTLNIGLTDFKHTSDSGYRYSEVISLNSAGQVAGTALIYDGGTGNQGQSAWIYNGTNTVRIGLIDAEHSSNSNGVNSIRFLNTAGHVVGSANRYTGGGQSAWLYNGTSSLNIGLTGAQYTGFGFKRSDIIALNAVGQVLGTAWDYSYPSYPGKAVWLYNGSNTINIGLTNAEHTAGNGFVSSEPGTDFAFFGLQCLNDAGQAIGSSDRYNGGATQLGYTAWMYNGTSTLNIGLTSAEYTRDDGFRNSRPHGINSAGRVIGTSQRFNGAHTYLGSSTWYYNGTNTFIISPTDAEHTSSEGFRQAIEKKINAAGQVIGGADRFNGDLAYNPYYGNDAWFYDPTLNQTFQAPEFSVRDDGLANSSLDYLSEEGVAVGSYKLYSGMTELGSRAMAFTVADGWQDLGISVDGGLAAHEWQYLADSVYVNASGQIIGNGLRTTQTGGNSCYLLTPVNVTPTHNFAVVGLKAPKTISFRQTVTNKLVSATVKIQNRGANTETIPDAATLGQLITLTVHSNGACPDPSATIIAPIKFPLTLKSKANLSVRFQFTVNCVNDRFQGTGHQDYQCTTSIESAAIDGHPDTFSADDVCPRAPLGTVPNGNGTTFDKGCGAKTSSGVLGATVFMDVMK